MDKKDITKEGFARRAALKLLATGAAAPMLRARAEPAAVPALPPRPASDPDLVKPVVPWDGILSETEMKTVTALSDIILPADEKSPAASAVGVPEFINEWVSAPYAPQVSDREVVRGGLAWLNTEATKRFAQPFAGLNEEQKIALCEDIHDVATAKEEFRQGARFFDKFRNLCLSGFYTTEAGRKDLGYIGNIPLAKFPGASPEALKHLGLM